MVNCKKWPYHCCRSNPRTCSTHDLSSSNLHTLNRYNHDILTILQTIEPTMDHYTSASYEHLLYGQESDPERHVKRWQKPRTSYCTVIGATLLAVSIAANVFMVAIWDHTNLWPSKGSSRHTSDFHLYCMWSNTAPALTDDLYSLL